MKTILLDTNIFDKLAVDDAAREVLVRLHAQRAARFVVSRTTRDELERSPHSELLDQLPVEVVGNAAPIAGLMAAGDFLGSADHYFQHKGVSNKENDAQIATAAEFHADWLVSEDDRLRKRQRALSSNVEVLAYTQFMELASRLSG